jgi:hypothetical protein
MAGVMSPLSAADIAVLVGYSVMQLSVPSVGLWLCMSMQVVGSYAPVLSIRRCMCVSPMTVVFFAASLSSSSWLRAG